MMNSLVEKVDRTWYPHFQHNWDNLLFRNWVSEHVNPEVDVLDLGAGAGIIPYMNFRGNARRVYGVDLDSRVLENQFLDEAKITDAGNLPYGEGSFDLVISNNVLEHLVDPLTVFKEVNRVLKESGLFMFKTPNKWHYVSTIARLTPHSFHRWVNTVRGRADLDTFPTRFRANTIGTIKNLANATGFEIDEIKCIEGRPEYCRISLPTYIIGIIYERVVNIFEIFSPFRVLIMGKLRKKISVISTS